MPSYEHVAARTESGTLVLTITTPKIRTAETAHELRDELVNAVTSAHAGRVILDLGDVTFIGSVGLLGLINIRRIPAVERVALCNIGPVVYEMLVNCGLIQEGDTASPLEYHATLDEALQALASTF